MGQRKEDPAAVAEKYMVDESGYELKDYKFFCFDGFAKAMFIASDRQTEGEETKFDFYDMNFVHLPFTNGHPNSNHEIKRPDSFEKMKDLAAKLSEGIPQVRVDFYDINGKVYFGEITFAHWSGMVQFEPEEWDKQFGEWIKLPDRGGYLLANKGFILWFHEEPANGQDENIRKWGDCLISNDVIMLLKEYNVITESSIVYNSGLKDYKIWCFNGEPKMTLVCSERFSVGGLHEDFYDMDWHHLSFQRPEHLKSMVTLSRPQNYDLMKELASKLACNIPFVRVDFYEAEGRVYFGEITFFPASGFEGFEPDRWDTILGNWIHLDSCI